MTGMWVIVCGPSGAGKDSVIGWSRHALAGEPGIVFSRRLVTRASGDEGGDEETSRAALHALAASGALAWHWEANGHAYGVRSTYAGELEQGRIVVVNGSREHAASLGTRADVRRVLVTAPPAVLAMRLHARGRESGGEVRARLQRAEALGSMPLDAVIVNDGELGRAGDALVQFLRNLVR